jgi:hypothetical protein
MAKGALYWRLKDEQTGKWTYKKVTEVDKLYFEKGIFIPPQEEQ